MQKTKAGFTLIELLVVVLIIGILAAVAVPQYEIAVYKSRLTKVLVLMRAIKQANQVYYLANGEYTNDPEKWDIDLPAGYTAAGQNTASGRITLTDGTQFQLAAQAKESIEKPRVVGLLPDETVRLWTAYATDEWRCYPQGTDKGARICRAIGATNCTKEKYSCDFSF